MSDEIKEKIKAYYVANDIDELLNYITNLQKTNKNHSKKLIELGDKITNLQQENEIRQQDINNLTYQLAKIKEKNEKLNDKVEFYEDVDSDRCAYNEELQKENKRLKEEKDNLYLDNTMLKLEKDIYKQGYEDFKNLIDTLQNGSDNKC